MAKLAPWLVSAANLSMLIIQQSDVMLLYDKGKDVVGSNLVRSITKLDKVLAFTCFQVVYSILY